jgi:YhcH/YjgK/YiaL family protein
MVFDALSNFHLYLPLHPQFAAAFAFLQEHDLDALPAGRYDVDDAGAFVLISEYASRPLSECFIECHRRYIDIQLITSGREGVGYCRRSAGRELPYDDEKDFLKLDGEVERFILEPGVFAIFFPDDGHMPTIRLGETPLQIKKAVFKIPVLDAGQPAR